MVYDTGTQRAQSALPVPDPPLTWSILSPSSTSLIPISPSEQSLSPEEQRLFRLYGKLPSQAAVFAKNQQQRKYFDSGDYALNKAGKGDGMDTGTVGDKHPDPENIRHGSINSPAPGGAPSPAVGIVTPQLTKSTSSASGSSVQPGSGIASAGSIPVGSPAKESGLQRETSAEEDPADGENKENAEGAQTQAIPIRS